MSYQYIISKSVPLLILAVFLELVLILPRRLDPLFAIGIGLAAAATRINREEKEKGRSTQESVDVLKRRWNIWWDGEQKK